MKKTISENFTVPEQIKNCARRLMIGFHIPDYDQLPGFENLGIAPILSKFDPEEIVKNVKESYAQMFWFYSKCHYGNSYYPSKAGHIHSGMKGRDFFGEFTEACLKEGIIPGAVYEIADHRIMKDKPEWCHRVMVEKPDEEDIDVTDAIQGTQIAGACLNGPYGDYVIEQALEVAENYPIKAFYFDFLGLFNFGHWVCPYCNKLYEEELGIKFPGIINMDHKQYVAYTKWHYRQNNNFIKKLKQKIQQINPDILFTHNFHGTFPFVGLQRAEDTSKNCDFVTGDLFHLRSGMLQMSWKIRQYASLSNGNPGEVLLDYTAGIGKDCYTPKALDSYRAEIWTASATHAAVCSSVISRISGEVDQCSFGLVKKVFEEQKAYEPWLKDMKPVYETAILRSQNSIEFHPENIDKKAIAMNPGDTCSTHDLEFEGWCQALIHTHKLWDVISDHQVNDVHLAKYKTLILPSVGCMSNEQCEAVRKFVAGGGKVIATGDTSLYNEDGIQKSDFGLGDVLGIKYKAKRNHEYCQLKFTDRRFETDCPWKTDIITFTEGQMEIEASHASYSIGLILKTTASSLCNATINTQLSGAVQNNRSFYFAGNPGMQYRLYGQPPAIDMMKTLLDEESLIKLESSPSIELFAHTQRGKNNLIINLVNAISGVKRSAGNAAYRDRLSLMYFEEVDNLQLYADAKFQIKISSKQIVKNVYLAPDKTPIEFKVKQGCLYFNLERLGVHTTINIDFALQI